MGKAYLEKFRQFWYIKNDMYDNLKKFILLAGDIFVLYFSLYLTLAVRYWEQPSGATWQNHFGPFSIVFIAWILIFYISNLYSLHIAVNDGKFFSVTIRSVAISSLLSAAFFYVNPNISIAPKTNLVIYLVVFVGLFLLWRRTFNWLLSAYLPKNKVVVIGRNGQVDELAAVLKNKPHLGYKIALIVNPNGGEKGADKKVVFDKILKLNQFLIENRISMIVLATDPHSSPELRTFLFNCLPLKINFVSLPNFYEIITGKVPIEAIDKMWFLENLNLGNKYFFDLFKRLYDFILALAILLITLPLWFLIGLAVKLESRGPVFITMPRSGRNGKAFKMYKFRTMREEGNDRSLTVKNDPRITRFGSFLRKTRLDEIPQVLNIIMGQMSFVGPRPERPEFIRDLEKQIPFYRERMLVKPGATGWDQISGEYHSPTPEDSLKKLQYDLFYVKNRSAYLDLSIILKTVATVLSRKGL
ncbi:MAG: sugar transferase [Candidatus Falkowbacteria bacterium]